MITNYFHDLSVALLASNVLVIYFLGKYLDKRVIVPDFMPELIHRLSIVSWWALAFVLAGGGFRAWFFMEYEWNPAVGNGQIAALVVKHIVLVGVTLFGVIVQLRYNKKYGKN